MNFFIKIFEYFTDDLNYYLITEFCRGGELYDIIKEKGKNHFLYLRLLKWNKSQQLKDQENEKKIDFILSNQSLNYFIKDQKKHQK